MSRHDSGQGGFSLIEVLIAIGIFGLVAAFVSASLATGLRGALLGKRREVATQEASRVLELARSLAYDDLGLSQPASDPTIGTDVAIETVEGALSYLVDEEIEPDLYEPIMWVTNPTGHPFNPHQVTLDRGSTTLTRYVYVTGHDATFDDVVDFKRVIVRVVWDSAGTPGPANEVRAQTFVHPGGVFTAPQGAGGSGTTTGLTPMTGDAGSNSQSSTVHSARGSLSPLTDAVLPANPVIVTQPSTNGDTTFRAVSEINCTANPLFIQGSATYGQHPQTVGADDNSRTTTDENPPDKEWDGDPPDPVTGSDDVDRLLSQTALASTALCHATAEDLDAAPPTDDGLPYERGDAVGSSTIEMTEDVSGAGLPSSVMTVLEQGPHSATQDIDHTLVSGTREIAAAASATAGQTRVMTIPGVMPEGLVRVDPFTFGASLRTSPITPSQAPTVTSSGDISIRIFDPSSAITVCSGRADDYCLITIDPLEPGFDGFDVDASGSVVTNLGLTNVSFSVGVQALPPRTELIDGAEGPNGERHWEATYVPMAITTHMTIDVTVPLVGTVTLVESAVDLNFGSVSTHGCAGVACAP